MTKSTHNTRNQENIKMVKYIVEAPAPKKGQKASTGGIREKGAFASQFKNPVPYEEPTSPNTVAVQESSTALACREQERRNEAKMYFLNIVWQEFAEPLLRSGLHKLSDVIASKIEDPADPTVQAISAVEPEIIDVEAKELETLNDKSEIIQFTNKRAV